jgi:hypothetical protein
MSHVPVGLDLDDLTPKQLRQILRGSMRASMPKGKKEEKESDEESDEEAKENDDLVDLHREKGDSKPPKVSKDDMPKGVTFPEEEEEEEPKIASNKRFKK